MTNDNGKAYFGIGIDNSQLQADAEQAAQILGSIDTEAEKQSAAVRELLANMPTINLDIVSNASDTMQAIDAAFAEIDRVVDTNKAAVAKLEKEYERLGKEAKKAFNQGDDKAYAALEKQRTAIQKNITARKQINQEAAKTADALLVEEQRLKAETQAAQEAEIKHVSLKARLREVKMELVELEAAGQRGTAEYKALQQEAARLTDAFADAQAQASILAHDQAGLQGIISGLSGVSGAFTAAQGAVGLFSGENEKLQKIMLKVQSLMAITMGLQQLQATLNKDSAFSLVTLNGLKEWWNKLVAVGTGETIADTAATTANTAAETANAAAATAEAEAKAAAGAAATGKAGAEAVDTAATGANAVAATAGTAANIGLAGAFRMVGAAIKSIPVFGWIAAAIGGIIAIFSSLESSSEKLKKKLEEENKMMENARKTYAQASLEMENYKNRLKNFNGTKEEEARLVKEVNDKYGANIGYGKSASQLYDILTEKGEAYCKSLLMEAEAMAYLNKYQEAYIELYQVRANIASGEYHSWKNTKYGDEAADRKALQNAEAELEKWKQNYLKKMEEVAAFRAANNIGGFVDPEAVTIGSPTDKSKKVDPKQVALNQQKALDEYRDSVGRYIIDSNRQIEDLIIEAQGEGLTKELNNIRVGTARKKAAIQEELNTLAAARRDYAKQMYTSTGATEADWLNTEDGKKSIEEWVQVLFSENSVVKEQFDKLFAQVAANGEQAGREATQKYMDGLIDAYGTNWQKYQKLVREWTSKIMSLPPEFQEEANRQMDEALSKFDSERFKKLINWEAVFGNLSEQSLPVLRRSLEQVSQYFEQHKDSMNITEIKDYQQAIANLENEISKRNPFAALYLSLRQIKSAGQEYKDAVADMIDAQNALTAADDEYRAALTAQREIIEQIDRGELVEGCQEQEDANTRLTNAIENLNRAQDKNAQAENRVIKARNNITQAYAKAANGFTQCNKVIQTLGGNAKNLAAVFSDSVADSIGKALDFTDEILDATATVMNAIGDLGKGVAKGVETAVDAAATGSQAAAAAGAASLSTIEKASVILTIISAALQVATAIANLFNNDDKKQEEIERLQQRIDQLQWELDNQDVVRLQRNTGDALELLQQYYAEACKEIMRLYNLQEQWGWWAPLIARSIEKANDYSRTVQKIADHWADAAYTADKALGADRYSNAREQLENLAKQQILIQQQINEENSKKKTDDSKIQDYQNKIAELAEEMANLINDMLEDVIGGSAENIADQLGSAFVEAAKAGEDAMEAWHDKVNEIVGDIIRRMMIQKFLEPEIGKIFDKYKAKWFPNGDGEGAIDRIIESAGDFANELNGAASYFSQMWSEMSEGLQGFFEPDAAAREAAQKGIATASQESVDELNGRATAIQGHTYSISENTKILVSNTGAILQAVLNIESETQGLNGRIERVETHLREVRSSLEDMNTRGIKIR